MTQTNHYRNRAVRSPIQYKPQYRQTARIQDQNPALETLKRLCATQYTLHASFSPDESLMSEVKTEGLIAVRCELRLDDRLIGIGHASSVVDPRLSRITTRALYGCMNGSLSAAVHQGGKSLDVIRLDAAAEEATSDKGLMIDAYRSREAESSVPATEKQKSYLRELILLNCEDDTDRQQRIEQLQTLTKDEASQQIQLLARN